MKPKKTELVWVTWQDAVSDSSRTHFEDLGDVRLSRNVNLGWIVHENDRRIVLAHGYTGAEEIDYFAIPKGDIISIETAAYTPRKKRTEPHGQEEKQALAGS